MMAFKWCTYTERYRTSILYLRSVYGQVQNQPEAKLNKSYNNWPQMDIDKGNVNLTLHYYN